MEIKEKNFFKKIWTSIRDFEGYEEFAAERVLKAIKYIVLLTLIFTAVVAGIYTYKFYAVIEYAKNYVQDNIEDITLKDGKLEVKPNDTIEIENDEMVAVIATNQENELEQKEKYINKIKGLNSTGVIFLQDEMLIVSSALNEEQSIEYSQIMAFNIEGKAQFLQILETKNLLSYYLLFFFTMLIYLFIIYIVSHLIDAVVLGAIGYLFARLVRLRLKYKATFNIGVYALTLPIILNLIYIIINMFFGFEIKYFQWMYEAISYVYVAVAILMIKTEIINQKIQLIKLQEIQEQVAKEAEEKEVEKQKDEEEKEKDKKEKKEKDKTGEEPEGSNA